jgi:hypothetical protein
MSEKEAVFNAMKEAGKPVRPGNNAKALGIESKVVSKAIKARARRWSSALSDYNNLLFFR